MPSPSVGPDRPDVGHRAVAQDDVGLPLARGTPVGAARPPWRPSCHPADRARGGHTGPWSCARPSAAAAWCAASTPPSAVPREVVRDLVALAVRAPSAGLQPGLGLPRPARPADREAFWAATDDGTPPDAWRRGVSAAPALVLCLSDPDAYLDRYAEPDKGWTDRSTDHWPVPYWDTDIAMAAMVLLLGAEDAGLGALFFGVPVGAARRGPRGARHPRRPPARRGRRARATRPSGSRGSPRSRRRRRPSTRCST